MNELIKKYVGKSGTIYLDGLTIHVLIGDVKMAWGRERYLVSPIAGSGEIWVESIKLREDE